MMCIVILNTKEEWNGRMSIVNACGETPARLGESGGKLIRKDRQYPS